MESSEAQIMKNRDRGRRDLLVDGAVIFFLWGFAVAQPLFDLLARRAEFFAVRRSQPLDVLLLTAILAVLAPALLVLVVRGTALAGSAVEKASRFLVVATLIAALVLQVGLRISPFSGWTQIVLASVVGMAGAVLYDLWTRSGSSPFLLYVALGALIFPVAFLADASISRLLFPTRSGERMISRVDAETPIIMVVFDELATVSLMDERRLVDPVRYPNFSRLAKSSTWYRNATTVSDNTIYAVPSILTGMYPRADALPTADGHPQNLFTWLGRSYDLNVLESHVHLCPDDLRRGEGRPPGWRHRLVALLADLSLVYCHLLLPKDLAANLPSVSSTWQDFWSRDAPENPQASERRGRSAPGRIEGFKRFIESISSGEDRALYYAHVSLPHTPWEYLPSGQRYEPSEPANVPHGLIDHFWAGDVWHSTQGHQRYLLQLGFTDRLLGELLVEVERADLFDRALIIVTADHGVSFRPGDNYRGLTRTNYADIMSVPLFIKHPDQEVGEVEDTNVQTIDILPTIADVLRVELPWSVDGKSLLRPSSSPAIRDKIIYYFHAKERAVLDDDPGAKYATLARQIELFGTGADRGALFAVGRCKELIGRRVDTLPVEVATQGRIELDGPDDFVGVDPDGPVLPVHVVGELDLDTPADVDLAVAVNGVVRAVTQSYRHGTAIRFSTMIPPESLTAGGNRVDFFAIHPETDGEPRLAPLSPWRRMYTLERRAGGRGEKIVSEDGRVFPVRRNAVAGRVDRAVRRGGEMRVGGWAADLKHGEPATTLVFFSAGEFLFAAAPNRARPALGKKLSDPAALLGFRYGFSSRLLSNVRSPEIRIFALSSRGVASELLYVKKNPWRRRSKLDAR